MAQYMHDVFERIIAVWQSFLAGLAPAALFEKRDVPPPLSYEEAMRADREALRSDWVRIGADFRSVIEREYDATS